VYTKVERNQPRTTRGYAGLKQAMLYKYEYRIHGLHMHWTNQTISSTIDKSMLKESVGGMKTNAGMLRAVMQIPIKAYHD